MSAIFYHNEEQKRLAEETFKVYEAKKGKVQTLVLPATTFYDAEDYHQKYLLQKHPFILNALELDPGPMLNNSHVATRLNGYVGGYGTLAAFEEELPRLKLDDRVAAYVRNAIARGSNVAC